MDPAPDRVLGLDPAVPVDRVAPDPVVLRLRPQVAPELRAVQHLVGQVDPAELTDLVVPADPHRVDRADPHRVGQADLRPADLVVPVELRLVDLELTDPAGPAARLDRAGQVDLVARMVRTDRAALEARVDLVDLDPAGPVDLAGMVRTDRAALLDLVAQVDLDLEGMDPAGLVVPMDTDLAGLVAPVDHRRRLMCSMAPSIAVARSSAVQETRRTASARPIMVLRHRLRSMGSVGTAGPRPGVLRRTGTGRLLPVAGTVRRLPEVGTRRGTVPAAT
jgi:hypothetical protein